MGFLPEWIAFRFRHRICRERSILLEMPTVTERLPDNIAIIVLGPAGATLGRRLQAALPGSRVHGPSAHPADWDESYERASPHIAALFEAGRSLAFAPAAS